jgi:hypothetical protein
MEHKKPHWNEIIQDHSWFTLNSICNFFDDVFSTSSSFFVLQGLGVRATSNYAYSGYPELWILRYPAHRCHAGIRTHDPLVDSPTPTIRPRCSTALLVERCTWKINFHLAPGQMNGLCIVFFPYTGTCINRAASQNLVLARPELGWRLGFSKFGFFPYRRKKYQVENIDGHREG